MITLYVACGIPGSGKSTTFRSIKEVVDNVGKNTFEIVSRDAIRFAKLRENKNIQYFDKEKEVWKEYVDTIQKYLDEKIDFVVADATQLNQKSRNKLLDSLNLEGIKIIPFSFEFSLKTCLSRNELRKNDELAYVPREVIRRMNEQFEKPTFSEKYTYSAIARVNERGITVDLPDQ